MEGTESEAVFDSLNLNPQLFINEACNLVDDLLDEAFEYYQQHTSSLLKIEETNKSEELHKGIAEIRNMIQSVLDQRLGMWERYCMQHCFAIPEGFSLPKNSELPGDSSTNRDVPCDPDLDLQLASLRQKLAAAGRESAVLNRELKELERQYVSSNHFAGLINEAVQLYEQSSVHDMHQEIEKVASELRTKMEQLNERKMKRSKIEKIYNPEEELFRTIHSKGLYNAELVELQELIDEL